MLNPKRIKNDKRYVDCIKFCENQNIILRFRSRSTFSKPIWINSIHLLLFIQSDLDVQQTRLSKLPLLANTQMFVERQVSYSRMLTKHDVTQGAGQVGQNDVIWGEANSTSVTKFVNKAEQRTFLSTNIANTKDFRDCTFESLLATIMQIQSFLTKKSLWVQRCT